MRVQVMVFGMIKQKDGIGKKNRTAFEQSAQLLQGADGYPDCPVVITAWDDRSKCLPPGLHTAELYFEPAPYGQMVPVLSDFKKLAAAGAERPGAPVSLASK